jgi:hypothetical protein
MEQNPSWQADSSAGRPEVSLVASNSKVHHHIHTSWPPVPTQSQINPVHVPHSLSWSFSVILSFHQYLDRPRVVLSSFFPNKTLRTWPYTYIIATRKDLMNDADHTAPHCAFFSSQLPTTPIYLIFCWPYIIVYQYNETNVMQFLFSLLRIKGLYMFRALLAHIQEALQKLHLEYCVRVMSVGCPQGWMELHSNLVTKYTDAECYWLHWQSHFRNS